MSSTSAFPTIARSLAMFASCTVLGCSGSTTTAPKEPVTVRMGLAKEIAWLPLIAQRQGFFADEGVHLVPSYYPSGSRTMSEGFSPGHVDVACVGNTAVARELLVGTDLKILATIATYYDLYQVLANRDSGIAETKDLARKRIATQQRGSGMHYFLYNLLLREGISESEVDLKVEVPVEDQPSAIADGRIDAFASREPHLGIGAELLGEKRAALLSSSVLPSLTVSLVAHGAFVEQQPEAVRGVLRALLRAERFALESGDAAVRIIAEEMPHQSEQQVAREWKNAVLEVSLEQSLFVELENICRWMATAETEIPDLIPFVHRHSLDAVAPECVTLF